MRFNYLLLIIGFISFTDKVIGTISMFDSIEQNCNTKYIISSTCKDFTTSSEALKIIASGSQVSFDSQKLDQAAKDICNVCGSDFANIVPLEIHNTTDPMCAGMGIVYNMLPIMCKQNAQGAYCLKSFSNFQRAEPSSPEEYCSNLDCCSLEMLKVVLPANESAIVLNIITAGCNLPADLQTCKTQSSASTLDVKLSSTEIGLAAGGAVIGISAAAAGILFYVKRRKNPTKPKEIGLTAA
jgi:hypothetical protein